MKKMHLVPVLALALGMMTGAMVSSQAASDTSNLFQLSELSNQGTLIAGEHACGEGKCGEGKCGGHEHDADHDKDHGHEADHKDDHGDDHDHDAEHKEGSH